jgi:hypothetical protein
MSRQVPVSISSESDSPIAVTITSATDSAQTISSERTPDVALVSEVVALTEEDDDQRSDTIQHLDSESDDLEVLEAEAATARAKREEFEALEKLAKARRSRGSNSSARSVRTVRSSISSARLEAPPAQSATTAPAVLHDQPATPATAIPEHSPELPTTQPSWLDWFAAHAPRQNGPLTSEQARMIAEVSGEVPQTSVSSAFVGPYVHARARVEELEKARTPSGRNSDTGHGMQRFMDDREWELQAVRTRVHELESLINRPASRTSFASAASEPHEMPPGLPDVFPHIKHPSDPIGIPDPWQAWHDDEMHERVRARLFNTPEPMHVHVMPDRVPTNATPPPDPPTPSSSTDTSSSSSHKKKKKKKKKKSEPYPMKTAALQLPPHPNALGLPAWKRAMRTSVIASCGRPEKAREFIFEVESESATFESLAISDKARTRLIDARLAEALWRIIKGDLARRLAVAAEAAAMHGGLLSGRQILFLLYRDFARDSHQNDAQNYGHLEKLKCGKELRHLETFLTCWDNLMLQFGNPPKPDHLYQSFLMKIREIPELSDALLIQKRLPWGDEKKCYEELRRACEQVLEESKQERNRRQLDSLYEAGNVSSALAATPEEKKKMPCFLLRDGKSCPHGSSCQYSHSPAVIDKARKEKEMRDRQKGEPKGKSGKGGKGKDGKGKGKGKGAICPHYNSPQGCHYGSACRFLHETPAVAANALIPEPKRKPKSDNAAAKASASDDPKPKA